MMKALKDKCKKIIELCPNKTSTSTNENMKPFQVNPHKRKGD